MSAAEKYVVNLEKQLIATRDPAERHRLLQFLIKELVGLQNDLEFSTVIERRIDENNERYKRQKELVARLKDEGPEIRDAYFLAITIKTVLALYGYHRALARKILVCIVPRPA